jgi:hypothetical protein
MSYADKQVIWVGLAHVKNMGGVNRPIASGMGAEVFIAIRADSGEEFEHKAIAIFRKNRFQMIAMRNIEKEFDVPKDTEDKIANEKLELFKTLAGGARAAWGNFYPFGELEL